MEVGQEVDICSLCAIRGLSWRHPQNGVYELDVKVQEKRSVKEQESELPPLGVSRELHSPDRQITVPLHADLLWQKLLQRGSVSTHDKRRRAGDGRQRSGRSGLHEKRIAEAPWSLENGPTTAVAAKDRDPVSPARLEVDFICGIAAISKHNKMLARFPESHNLSIKALLAHVEEGFVASKILFGRC